MAEGPKSVEEVRKLVDKMGIEFIFAQFVEMYGKPNAKLVPANHLEDVFAEGAGFAGFAAGEIGQGPNDPDLAAMPDPASFTPVPWQPNLARFACDIYVEGEPWPYCPRIDPAQRQLARAKSMGYELQDRPARLGVLPCDSATTTARSSVADPLDNARPALLRHGRRSPGSSTSSRPGVQVLQTQLGWGNYANDHEDANGQFESNFRFDEALTTADRVIFFRYMVHTLAEPGDGPSGDVHAEALREPHRQRRSTCT